MSETVSLVKRRALGRGLGALIPQGTPANPPPADRRVLVTEIRPNPHQPRRYFDDARLTELAQWQGSHDAVIYRDADALRLAKRLRAHWDHLFTFLDKPDEIGRAHV